MNADVSAPTAEQLQAIKREREVALLRKWTAGRRLAPAEMSELQHLLPVAVLANPPKPRVVYRHGYDHYARQLGVDVRNIKRYVKLGREVVPDPDLPPFDNPPAFLGWWQRRMKQQPPAHVLEFARLPGSVPAAAAAAVVAPAGVTENPPPPPTVPLGFEFAGAGGFEESVRELRATVAAAQARLRRAMQAEPHDESLVASCNRAVEKQLDLLRKTENDLFDMQRKRGDLLPRAEVREDWRTLLSALRQMRKRMADNIANTLSATGKFPPDLLVLVRGAVESERTREDQLLRGSKHWRQSSDVSAASSPAA